MVFIVCSIYMHIYVYLYLLFGKENLSRRIMKPKRYEKYGLFLLSHDYLVVAWAAMLGNECFMVIYIYIRIHLNEVFLFLS